MIVAAAMCAAPPLLNPALTGREAVLPELRSACAGAVARLLPAEPEVIVVVGPAAATGEWDAAGRLDVAAFAPGSVAASAPGSGAGTLPLSLGLGAMLLDQGGYRGRRRLVAVGPDAPSGTCAALGAELATGAARTALLVMGDGSARRSLKAPGHLDPRAEPFDAEVERAVRAGRLGALLELDEALARDLMVTGRPAWQVLAGAMLDGTGLDGTGLDGTGLDGTGLDGTGLDGAGRDGTRPAGSGRDGTGTGGATVDGALVTEVLYCDDPFGVAYLVACLHPHGQPTIEATIRKRASASPSGY